MLESPGQMGKMQETLSLAQLDRKIDDMIAKFTAMGLDMSKWSERYYVLPDDVTAFNNFFEELKHFEEQRTDLLSSFEFGIDLSESEKQHIRQLNREVLSAYKDIENFLGNGATAEIYAMRNNDKICVKFITDQDRYNENNHIRHEYEYLSHVYKSVQQEAVRVPYPVFLRVHPQEGHSYGMEKISGASLSQILELSDTYPDLITIAQGLNRQTVEDNLLSFITAMHEAGLTHCDLYKRNIMMDHEGRFFVIDFGKAKKIDFPGDREEERKSDLYNAKQTIRDFFSQIDDLTNVIS